MSALDRAQVQHRDACLDNHDEASCVAIQLAHELDQLQVKFDYLEETLIGAAAKLYPTTQYREGVRDGLHRAVAIVSRVTK